MLNHTHSTLFTAELLRPHPLHTFWVYSLHSRKKFAPFTREIHYTTDANSRHGRGFCRQLQYRCKMYSCFCKSTKMYIQLRVTTYNHDYFVLHFCLGFSASTRNDVTARASSWLVSGANIRQRADFSTRARFTQKKRSIRAIRAASFARIAPQDCHSRLVWTHLEREILSLFSEAALAAFEPKDYI